MSAETGTLDLDNFKSRLGSMFDGGLETPEMVYTDRNSLQITFPKKPYTDGYYNRSLKLFVDSYQQCNSHVDVTNRIYGTTLAYHPEGISDKQKVMLVLSSDCSLVDGLRLQYTITHYATSRDIEFLRQLNALFRNEKSVEEKLKELGADIITEGQSWDALAGYEDVKDSVRKTVILPFLHPDAYASIVEQTRQKPKDIRPRAVLFYGPPGTGKTTMGRIVAKEISKPFIYVPVETIFTCWYGESPRRLGRIFDLAYEMAENGCVMFVDEIDALASKRDNMHEESRRVMSVLLTRLYGLKSRHGVVTIGTTNLIESLDGAVRRRFDEEIYFPNPSLDDRKGIIKMYAKHLAPEDVAALAEVSEGLSGSHIERAARTAERDCVKLTIENGHDGLPTVDEYLRILRKTNQTNTAEQT